MCKIEKARMRKGEKQCCVGGSIDRVVLKGVACGGEVMCVRLR